MKDVYTTKTGVKIGLAYEPPRRIQMSGDMERLQSAMLSKTASILPNVSIERLLDIVCWVMAIVALIGMFTLGSYVFA